MRAFPLLLVVLVIGCQIGPRIEKYEAAHSAHGTKIEVLLQRGRIAGELLAVSDSGVFLLDSRNLLVFTPYTAVRQLQLAHLEPIGTRRRLPPSDWRETARLRSRFPQGLSDELRRRLLEAYGQHEFQRVTET